MAGVKGLMLVLALAGLTPLPAVAADLPLTVANHAKRTINELYVSPVSSGDWGADWLGDGNIVPGASQLIRIDRSEGCKFDLQVVYENAAREDLHDVDICRTPLVAFTGANAVAPAGVGGAHPVVIVNDSTRPIQQVLISPADSGDWGDDLLTHGTLSAGSRVTLTYRGSCLADLRVVYDNRSAEERHTLDVCALHGVVIRPGWTTADLLPPLPAKDTAPP